ncbi:MAG: hypothetical protein HWE21_16060 [Cytophagia bacterium]|nr:hypothetical protein [Cytophagia bacterium]
MKKLFALLILSFFIFSCGEDANPESIQRYFYGNSEVSPADENTGLYVNWTDGSRTVFRFIKVHPEEENIADDELTEVFWIEIPSDVTEFSANLNTDSDVETYYTRSCFCGFEAFEFTELEVSGNKLDNGTWDISFKMTAKTPAYNQEFSLEDSGIYFPGER